MGWGTAPVHRLIEGLKRLVHGKAEAVDVAPPLTTAAEEGEEEGAQGLAVEVTPEHLEEAGQALVRKWTAVLQEVRGRGRYGCETAQPTARLILATSTSILWLFSEVLAALLLHMQALESAWWGTDSVHTVVLVGKATRLPAFRSAVRTLFPSSQTYDHMEADYAAQGAALLGWAGQACHEAADEEEHKPRLRHSHGGKDATEAAGDELCDLLLGLATQAVVKHASTVEA